MELNGKLFEQQQWKTIEKLNLLVICLGVRVSVFFLFVQ